MGFGIRSRLTVRGAARSARRQRPRTFSRRHHADNLHVGSGPLVREGWTNADLEHHPGVEFVLDVRDGLPFENVSYIYAEGAGAGTRCGQR
ncbi:MAG TPA: hypothetical protein VLU46_12675 [Thermoanaerobaculia bacterium]|nr:hypothetical protein [Thermoanaerobaculia bacterium]